MNLLSQPHTAMSAAGQGIRNSCRPRSKVCQSQSSKCQSLMLQRSPKLALGSCLMPHISDQILLIACLKITTLEHLSLNVPLSKWYSGNSSTNSCSYDETLQIFGLTTHYFEWLHCCSNFPAKFIESLFFVMSLHQFLRTKIPSDC